MRFWVEGCTPLAQVECEVVGYLVWTFNNGRRESDEKGERNEWDKRESIFFNF